MDTSEEIGINEAARLAELLKSHVPNGEELQVLWERTESDEALRLVRAAGFDPREFLGDIELDLNFNVSGFAKRFYEAYSNQVHVALCSEEGDLRKAVSGAIGTGTASVITTLAAALAVPIGAAMLIAPIASILLVKGVDAFCAME